VLFITQSHHRLLMPENLPLAASHRGKTKSSKISKHNYEVTQSLKLPMRPQNESTLTPTHPDFYIRRAIKGTPHVFQVYFTPTQAWFIRIGSLGTTEIVVAVQGGLIGGLLAAFMQSRRKKKEAQTIAQHTAKTLEQMLAEHNVNHVLPLTSIANSSLERGGWAYKKGTVIWKFQEPSEKRQTQCFFHKQEDIDAAMQQLPKIFQEIRIEVAFDERKGKYLKRR
jgi:hypothetical protein